MGVSQCTKNTVGTQRIGTKRWFILYEREARLLLGLIPATTGWLMYVRGCKGRDKYAQIEILRTKHVWKRVHKILTWKTQNREKPQGSTNPKNRITMMRGSTIRDSEATTLSSSLSTDGDRVSNSYTLTLSLTQLHRQRPSLTILQWYYNTTSINFALVIYILIQLSGYLQIWPTRGTFRLFIIIASRVGHEIDSRSWFQFRYRSRPS